MLHRRQLDGLRRHPLAHLNGLVRIGTGRDAADAAVASIFGSATCTEMMVDCTLGEGQKFQPIDRKHLIRGGVALAPRHDRAGRRAMRLHIEHTTTYRYARPVTLHRHRLVVRPREGHDLRVERMHLDIAPEPSPEWVRDVFGNSIALVDWLEAADTLTIVSDVILERLSPFPARERARAVARAVSAAVRPARSGDHGASTCADLSRRRAARRAGVAARAALAVDPHDAEGAMLALCRLHPYDRRVPAPVGEGRADAGADARLGTGSCRDMATLHDGGGAALGVAARFASGYLHGSASMAGRWRRPTPGPRSTCRRSAGAASIRRSGAPPLQPHRHRRQHAIRAA